MERPAAIFGTNGIVEPDALKALRRLGPIVKSWTPRTGAVDFHVDKAVIAMLEIIDELDARIAQLEARK